MPGSLAACGRWPVASPRRTEADAKRGLGVTHGARLHPEKLQKLLPGQACREGRIGQTTPLLQRHRDSGEPRGDSLGSLRSCNPDSKLDPGAGRQEGLGEHRGIEAGLKAARAS